MWWKLKAFVCNLLSCLMNIFLIFCWKIIWQIKLVGLKLFTPQKKLYWENNYAHKWTGSYFHWLALLADLSLTAFPCATVHENLLAGIWRPRTNPLIRLWFHPAQYTVYYNVLKGHIIYKPGTLTKLMFQGKDACKLFSIMYLPMNLS